jgi:hypothetical protein
VAITVAHLIEEYLMDRTRRVLAASGISIVVVAGSAAFAVNSGLFVSQPVDRVGSFQSIEARLLPVRKQVGPTTTAGAAPPTASSTTTTRPVEEGTAPEGVQPEPTSAQPEPTTVPPAPSVQPTTTIPVAHSGTSVVPSKHRDDGSTTDDGTSKEDGKSDD